MKTLKTRLPIEQMLEVQPNTDLQAIQTIFDELETLGFTFVQWEDYVLEEEEEEPVFMEAFGPQFMRADESTYLECAKVILENYKKRLECKKHEFAYTHSNGNKTCKHCRYFTKCTIEEALENYEKGEVKWDEYKTLKFNHLRSLCSCGSHKVFYLKHAFDPKKKYQCANETCNRFVPLEEVLKGDYIPKAIPKTMEERMRKLMVFKRNRTLSPKSLTDVLVRFVTQMYLQAKYVDKLFENENWEQTFIDWVQPYTTTFVSILNCSVKLEDEDVVLVIKDVKLEQVRLIEKNGSEIIIPHYVPEIAYNEELDTLLTEQAGMERSLHMLYKAFEKTNI